MEDFIEGFGITQHKLAVSIEVPPRRINEIVHGKRGITADTALRLARYFGTSAEFWINLQSHYELDRAEDLAGEQIASITPRSFARAQGRTVGSFERALATSSASGGFLCSRTTTSRSRSAVFRCPPGP